MRKFLSVLLAVMMVVSTVSFAAPQAVYTADDATNAVVEETTEVTTEASELAAESDYGTLVYSVDFERDDFDVAAFTTAYAQVKSSKTTAYQNPDFSFGNMTCYTNAAGDGFSNAQLVTEGENTYITGDVAASYDGYFRMTKYTMTWPDGIYTFSVDVKVPAGQVASWAAQCNDNKLALTAIAPFSTTSGEWQTVVYQTTNVVRGSNSGSTDTEGFYGFFMTPRNSTAGTVSYDNWKVYYKAPTATVTIDPNGKSGNSEVWITDLVANSDVEMSTLVAKAKEMDSTIIGLATEPEGAMIDTANHHVEYYDRLYAVYGFDINVMANGNSDVEDMIIEDIDTRHSYTVGQIVAMFNSTAVTDRILRGVSNTPKGEPLADNTVINKAQTLYLIWETDGSEYGTLLASIDFENLNVGDTAKDYGKVELFDPDALTNGEFTINWQVGKNKIAQEDLGNKYIRGGQGWAQILINNSKFRDANAPMPEGKYTILVNTIDFGTTKRNVSTTCQAYAGVTSGTPNSVLDSFTGENNKWDLFVGQWNGSSNDFSVYYTDGATTDVGFDNIKLFFEPNADAVFSITVDANGRSGVSNKVAKVNNGSSITAGELAALMPGCVGVSLTVDGEALPSDYIIAPDYNKTVYAVWEYEESEFGTLLFEIDFEREGITFPTSNSFWNVVDVATSWNKDLVYGNVYFNIGSGSTSGALNNKKFVTENGNTYYEGDAVSGYNFISALEYQDGIDWLNGTYTYVMDVKTSNGMSQYANHANNSGTNVTVLDGARLNDPDRWDRVAIQYNGVLSDSDRTGSIYLAPNVSGGTLAVDNVKLFFKTAETRITLKPNGNTDLSDIVVPVSTSTGITVAELIAKINEYDTTKVLLGISEAATGELLSEDLIIIPKYQKTLYMQWKSKSDNLMIDDKLGKLLFSVDFERQEVIDANWNGIAHELDNVLGTSNSGGHVEDVATLYDDAFKGKNVRVKFTTFENALGASIKTSSDGNHYIEAEGINTRWPQVGVNNFGNVKFGNGIYTVFIDANATGANSFAVHSNMTSAYGSSIKHLDGKNAAGNGWAYTDQSWATYSYSYEITGDANLPGSGAYFSFNNNGGKVAFDNYKLYYKPFTATITINPGEYEDFGVQTVENISTTGEDTGADIVEEIQEKLDVCGREFVGLMDEYGDMLNLDKALVIPGNVTYTIVWGDFSEIAPETYDEYSVRYSTKATSRGIRFKASLKTEYALADGSEVSGGKTTTEYGWIVTRPEFLESAGINPALFTKESLDQSKIISGTAYNAADGIEDYDAARKHFSEDDENVEITVVIYGVPAQYYKKDFVVRPYIVYDGKTYYGQPKINSMYEIAQAQYNSELFDTYDEDLKKYIISIIENAE